MASTFLSLTNQLLRRINEVTIDQADFASARGIHAMAKDIVDSACQEITEAEFEWPFNATSTTQVLVAGTEEYAWPAGFLIPKWNSFHIVKDDALDVTGHPLGFISRDVWLKRLKTDDDYVGATGRGVPYYVFEKNGEGFAVSPSPDAAYTVSYEYFAGHTTMTDHDDTPTIPTRWDEVIIQCALYHLYMFRDNSEQAKIAEDKYLKRLQNMRTLLINKEETMRSTMIQRSNRYARNIETFDI